MGIQEDIVCFLRNNPKQWFNRNEITEGIGYSNPQAITHALGRLSNYQKGKGLCVQIYGVNYRIIKSGKARNDRVYGLFEE